MTSNSEKWLIEFQKNFKGTKYVFEEGENLIVFAELVDHIDQVLQALPKKEEEKQTTNTIKVEIDPQPESKSENSFVAEANDREKELEELKQQLDAKDKYILDLEREIHEKNEQIKYLERDLVAKNSNYMYMSQQAETLFASEANLVKIKSDLLRENENLMKKLNEKDFEFDTMEIEITDLRNLNKVLDRLTKHLKEELDGKDREIAQKQDYISGKLKELEEAKPKVVEIQIKIDHPESIKVSLFESVNKIQ